VKEVVPMKKILVIDDELAYLTLLRDELLRNGYEVFEASNGKEGLVMIKKSHPDLILLDIRMPMMNGMQMLDAMRREPNGSSVKVIVLTNLEPNDEMIAQVIKSHPTYYFIKSDIELSELMNKIRELA